jgi:hypothetical protein
MKGWPRYRLQSPDDPPGGDPPKGDPPPPKTIPVDVLPEELRDRPEAEIKFLLGHMVTALGERNNTVDDLKTQVAELRNKVGNSPPPPATPDPDADKPLEELILEDTEKALDRYLEKRGYVREVAGISEQVGETTFALVAAEIDDFEEHEDAVRKILEVGKLAPTKKNIMGAYTMALGQKQLAERGRTGRRGTGSIPPSNAPPAPDPNKAEPKLSALEQEVMRAHGVKDPAVWAAMRDNPPEIKLRTS